MSSRIVAEFASLEEISVPPSNNPKDTVASSVKKEVIRDETPVSLEHQTVPFVLSFNNLTYSVKIRQKMSFATIFSGKKNTREVPSNNTKVLLNDISGQARDGEILAILGSSGSGKSTLIDALANRITRESLKGTTTLNDQPLESTMLKVMSAYVMQDDLLYPMLTVEETLMFAAEFRLPRTLPKSKKKLRVQTLIDQLGLRDAAKTVIGDEGHRGVSGGERRRVSIGIDVIHDPIILFLDEPTSGLDSTSAFMVVEVLQRIARSGSIVIMSIHQPSYRILGLLDRLLLLSNGCTVYSGSPSSLTPFFADFGQPIPENENPTEFALDLTRELESSLNGTITIVEFNKTWQNVKANHSNPSTQGLPLKEALSASISRGKLVSGVTGGITNPTSVPTFANPLLIETIVLSKRSLLNSYRTPKVFLVRLGGVILSGLVLASIFWKLDNSPQGFQEKLTFYTFAISTFFYTCAYALPIFIQERYIFMRETSNNAYRRLSYSLAHTLVFLPSLGVISIAFAGVTFWSVGLAGGFLFHFLIILAAFWTGDSFVTFISGVISHVMLGYTITVAFLSYFVLFSGYFINQDRIPHYWIWFHYISLVRYPYEASLISEFNNPTNCFVQGLQIFDNIPLASSLSLELKEKLLKSMGDTLGESITNSTCFTTGVDLLKQQGVTQLSKWDYLWITIAWGFFFRFLFYCSLLLWSKNKRS